MTVVDAPQPDRSEADRRTREEFRAWVRAHHPDVGGDPQAFTAGLEAWRDRLAGRLPRPTVTYTEVTVFRRRSRHLPVRRWLRRWAGARPLR